MRETESGLLFREPEAESKFKNMKGGRKMMVEVHTEATFQRTNKRKLENFSSAKFLRDS